jgi:hypothetical protein
MVSGLAGAGHGVRPAYPLGFQFGEQPTRPFVPPRTDGRHDVEQSELCGVCVGRLSVGAKRSALGHLGLDEPERLRFQHELHFAGQNELIKISPRRKTKLANIERPAAKVSATVIQTHH